MDMQILILKKGFDPKDLEPGNYYLITANGIFMRREDDLTSGLLKVNSVPFLGTAEPFVSLKLPGITQEILLKAWLFFRKVFRVYKSEANLSLYYNKKNSNYMLLCRPQTNNHVHVKYGRDEEFFLKNREAALQVRTYAEDSPLADYNKVGTIHSHCDFEAFHSYTDHEDFSKKDGVHITIGHVDQNFFSLTAAFVVNNNYFSMSPEKIIPDIEVKNVVSKDLIFYNLTLPWDEQQRIEAEFKTTLEEWVKMVGVDQHRAYQYVPDTLGKVFPDLAIHDSKELHRVRSHARALQLYRMEIPAEKQLLLKTTLQKFFNKQEITHEDLALACTINAERRMYEKASS